MTTDRNLTADYDGCNRRCRLAGAHTLAWGECEHAPQPEPTVSLSCVYTDTDGHPSIGFDTYTVPELARLIEPVLGDPLKAAAAARRIVHRHDDLPAAVPVPPPADRPALLLWAADRLGRMDYDTDNTDYGYDTYRDAWNGGVMDAAALLRRVAAEEQPAEAHPSHDSWLVEWRAKDGDWAVAYPTHDHSKALDRLARGQQEALDWQWRLVRETSTYTVEAEHTPPTARPAVGEQPETQETPRG